MEKIWQNIQQLLAQEESFALATITSQSGSSPRTAGAKMVVKRDRSIIGTIGGGLVEARVQQLAQDVLEQKRSMVRFFQLNGQDYQVMDMICGGELEILIDYIDASDAQIKAVYTKLPETINQCQQAVLITDLAIDEGKDRAFALLEKSGELTGRWPYGKEILAEILTQVARKQVVVSIQDKRFLVEPLTNHGTVYILGAGHVAQKLATLVKTVDFRCVVFDDRLEFANEARFPSADEVKVLDNFDNCFEGIKVDKDSFLVIVTRGHAHDKTVLGEALKTTPGYIGMIGSKRKREAIYEALQKEGVTPGQLAKVHSPIGLEIEAETPEEIAVSIVAELIQVRAGLQK